MMITLEISEAYRSRVDSSALVMLADGCEARVRAQRPDNKDALREMIKDTVEKRVADGQLDHTDLTLQDLDTIIEIYTASLRSIYHPRVEYPPIDVPTRPSPALAWRTPDLPEPISKPVDGSPEVEDPNQNDDHA